MRILSRRVGEIYCYVNQRLDHRPNETDILFKDRQGSISPDLLRNLIGGGGHLAAVGANDSNSIFHLPKLTYKKTYKYKYLMYLKFFFFCNPSLSLFGYLHFYSSHILNIQDNLATNS